MQTLELNLASRPFKNNTLIWLGLALTVLLLVLISVWNVHTFRQTALYVEDLTARQGDFRQQYAELERREGQINRELQRHELGELTVQASKANDVIHWKAFSWTRLFNQLQEVLPYDVQMTSVRPVFREDRRQRSSQLNSQQDGVPVNVEGVAKSVEAFLDFERRLFDDPHFDSVEPEGYETNEHSRETIFRMRFRYRPGETPAPGAEPPAPEDQAAPAEEPVETMAANEPGPVPDAPAEETR